MKFTCLELPTKEKNKKRGRENSWKLKEIFQALNPLNDRNWKQGDSCRCLVLRRYSPGCMGLLIWGILTPYDGLIFQVLDGIP